MSLKEDYAIPIFGLKEGIHEYEFEAKSGFFELFENPDIPDGDLNIKLILHKKSQFMELRFYIEGFLTIECDRCLDQFNQPIDTEEDLYVRFGDDYEEVSDNLIVIPRDASRINIAQYIYEFAALSLPVQNIHPDDEKGESLCNKEMLRKLAEHSERDSDRKDRDKEEENIDPRWEVLKKLKDLN